MVDIAKFKSTMNKYGGPAKSNLFTLRLGPTVGASRKTQYIPNDDLLFFCSEVAVPSVNMNVISHRPNTLDMPQSFPTSLTAPGINATFMLDSEHRVISFFHSWMQEIINYDVTIGNLSQINSNHMPYEIGYKEDYACDITIDHYKTNTKGDIEEAYKYKFFKAFPTEVGGKTFSWNTSDSIATVTINFSAAAYSFSASDPGQITSSLARGNGDLDALISIGFVGQTVQQRNLPTSVQDAINTFTTVRNDFNTVQNAFANIRNII